MMLATDLVVLDHYEGSAILVANAILPPDARRRRGRRRRLPPAIGRLDAMTTALSRPTPPMVSTVDSRRPAGRRRQPYAGRAATRRRSRWPRRRSGPASASRSWWRSGSSAPTDADPLDVYRVLRTTNPSPYMYLLRFDGFDIVGSSPEAHVKVTDAARRALLHPIAGTRPRGATPEEDAALAAELLADPKERAEHVMLVDLGRNDLGRVCRAGHGRGAGVRHHRAVQPRHAHRVDRGRRAARRPDGVRRARRDVPGRHAVRRAEGAGDGDHRGAGADPARRSTAARSATSASAATWTWRSRSAPR